MLPEPSQTITIDDEDAATVELTGTATVLESGTVDLTITLGTAAGVTLQDALTVDLNALASSTGLDPADYSFSSADVIFDAGDGNGETRTITLTPVDDDLVEGNETVDAEISLPTTWTAKLVLPEPARRSRSMTKTLQRLNSRERPRFWKAVQSI